MAISIVINRNSASTAETARTDQGNIKKLNLKSVRVGSANHNNGNGYPFISYGNGRYQQIYSASAFSQPLYISKLSFFNSEFFPGTAIISTANYKIRLSTTQRQVKKLNSNFANNLGSDVKTFFEGILSGNTGIKFDISGASDFFYDPAKGNLLIDIVVSNNQNNGSGLLDIDTSGTVISCTSYGSTDSIGLITEFTGTSKPISVPNFTGNTSLLPFSFFGVGSLLRRKQPQNVIA